MGRDSGHQNQRPVHFGQLSEDENRDFVSNFRDEGLNVVDQYSKIVFPLSYVLFNICYWIIYLAT